MFAALRRFWSRGTEQKISIIILTCAVLLAAFGGVLAVAKLAGGAQQASVSSRTPVVTISPIAQVGTTSTSPVATSTPANSALTPTATRAPLGPPQVGAPLSDFTAAYGAPNSQAGNAYNFTTSQNVSVSVRIVNSVATYISVSGPASWSNSQSMAACVAYLPADASELNSADPYTYYHASIGEIVINNTGSGTCRVYLAD